MMHFLAFFRFTIPAYRPLFSGWLLMLIFTVSAISNAFSQNGESSSFSYELSGNKLFVYGEENTYSFAPYGRDMLRVGLHFGQDTTYPASLSVIIDPEGPSGVEDLGDELYYFTEGYEVIIDKDPISFLVVEGADTLVWSGDADKIYEGSRMQFYTDAGAAWYGGGSRAIPMNRAGMDLIMLNEPFYGYGWGQERLNISIPLVVSSEGFALYFENPTPGLLSLGSSEPGLVSYDAALGPISCFVIRTPDPDSLMEPYTLLTGRQPLPPMWALGYIQSRFGYEDEQEATQVVNNMVGQGFPMDAIIFDLQWQGGVGEMGNLAWDLSRFPDPQGMMEDFLEKGVKSVCIADPYFTENSQFFAMMSGLGWFATEQDGTPYIIDEFWAGPAGLIDVTDAAAANWFWQRCKGLLENGVTGLWTDLGEPERAPEDMFFDAGSSTAIRQTYNLRWAGGIYEQFTEDFPGRRLFNLTRSGYAGMQRYSTFPWSGDVEKSPGGMYAQVPIMLGMGLCGFGYMGHDVGGFVGGLDPVLYTRWQQMGAFSPVMRAHGVGVITEPIYFQEPYKSIVKSYIELRYRLLPYNYTLAYINSTTGMPLVRPLFFEDPALLDVNHQYLWGNDILVAPVFDETAMFMSVSFPAGKWIEYFSFTSWEGGINIDYFTPILSRLPLFIRAGAMIPMIPEIQHTEQYNGGEYIVRYFADPGIEQSRAMIYMDDGITRQAEQEGEFSIISLDAFYVNGNATVHMSREGSGFTGEPLVKNMVFEVPRAAEAPASVYYNFVQVPLTDEWNVYNILDEAAFFNPLHSPPQLYVKVEWNSTSPAILEISGLELETDISVPENQKPEVNVYPNPLEPGSRIHIEVSEPGEYRLVLRNSLGQEIGTASLSMDSRGSTSRDVRELFPKELGSGIYVMTISGRNGVSENIKILVVD